MPSHTPTLSNAIRLECPVLYYEWGKRGVDSLVAQLKGDCSPAKSYAELWIGAHPNAPSVAALLSGPVALDQLIKDHPLEILGAESIRKFGKTLPLLFKVLSVGSPLSIQAHPDKTLAAKLRAKDADHYPDDNHKPEIAIVLSRLELLAGFRPIAELKRNFENYPELKLLLPPKLMAEVSQAGAATRSCAELTKAIYEAVLSCDPEKYLASMNALAARLKSGGVIKNNEHKWFLRCFEIYGPTDVGLASIFILNLTSVEPGLAVFLGSNIPHAYLEGDLVECMANSDNVVRAGLTRKFQDRPTLIDMLDYTATNSGVIVPTPLSADGSHVRFEAPATEFFVERLAGRSNPYSLTVKSAEFVLLLEGKAAIITNDVTLNLQRGQAALIPACAQNYTLVLDSEGVAYRAGTPL